MLYVGNLAEMKPLIILLAYLLLQTCAYQSPQQERCEKLQSVADSAAATCSVGHSCFSLDCTPNLPVGSDTEFHISIEPCKQPASILINGTVAGHEFSHEFSHSETVAIPALPLYEPKIAVVIDNSDSQNIVFSVKLITIAGSYTIVPETSFPLNNITCANGHLVTSANDHMETTANGHMETTANSASSAPTQVPYSCEGTCAAIHKMTSKTRSLCGATGDCLTINCDSPHNPLAAVSSAYTIEQCTSPPTIMTTFDDHNNNKHFSKNITHNSTFSLPYSDIGNPKIQVTLVDVSDYAILFGVNLIFLKQTIQILPDQTIPIDKSGCPGYTGPATNPYCTTQSTEQRITTHVSFSSAQHPHTDMHTGHTTANATGIIPVSPSLNNTAAVGSDVGKLAGIIVAVILVNVVIVLVAVLVTIGVVWYVFKRKNRGVYTYSHFQALEEDD